MANESQRLAVTTDAGRGFIAGVASGLAQLGVLILNEMAVASGTLSEAAATGSARLGSALGPIQDLGQVMTFVSNVLQFTANRSQQVMVLTGDSSW